MSYNDSTQPFIRVPLDADDSSQPDGIRQRYPPAPAVSVYSHETGTFSPLPQTNQPAPFGAAMNPTSFFAAAPPPPRASLFQRLRRAVRNVVAPKRHDYEEGFGPAATRCSRTRNICMGMFLALAIILSAFATWLYVNGKPALGLLRQDVETIEKYITPTGFVVYNVRNPTRPVTTVGDVNEIALKLRSSKDRSINLQTAARGYLTYRTAESNLDANATIDGLLALMKQHSPLKDGVLCEGLIHYGIERNAIYVNQWGDDADNSTGLLYNPSISERSDTQIAATPDIQLQDSCRISRIVEEMSDEPINRPNFTVSDAATLEYVIESGKKRRKKIRQPLIECIDHVLKLSGVK